ncbi:hypothetical protein SN13_00955 [Vibrio alginolyticus]|nr:hypothetical protein SN12_13200 [Vibrio alginolyticus]KIP85826.1 hypothetical protein SN13_00955 [Vibrio alginolyticus]
MKGQYPYYGASGVVDYVNDYIFDGDFILLGEDGENILSRNLPLAFKASGKIWVNNHAHVMTPKDEFHIDYLVEYLESLDYSLLNSGTAQPKLNKQACLGIVVVKPSREEQTAIANALSDVDALLTELEKLIAKKQAIKTATMQQLLTGKTRLPQFATYTEGEKKGQPKGTKSSELGEIPEDWDVITFAELKDKNDQWAITGGPFGSNLKSSDYTESGVRIIQLQNIGDGVFKNDDFVFTSVEKANELRSCNIYPNEIILSKMGDPVARACLIPEFHSRYLMCSDGIRLKVDENKHSYKFIFYSLNFPTFRNQALDASTGSTRKRIGLTELKTLLIKAPCKDEQTAIATILSDMDSEIQTLEQRLAKTRQIKQGMMQELLTGRTRLPFEKES